MCLGSRCSGPDPAVRAERTQDTWNTGIPNRDDEGSIQARMYVVACRLGSIKAPRTTGGGLEDVRGV